MATSWVRVVYAYSDPTNDKCLRLAPGDLIKVEARHKNGWWVGELDGKRGVFPGSFTVPHGTVGPQPRRLTGGEYAAAVRRSRTLGSSSSSSLSLSESLSSSSSRTASAAGMGTASVVQLDADAVWDAVRGMVRARRVWRSAGGGMSVVDALGAVLGLRHDLCQALLGGVFAVEPADSDDAAWEKALRDAVCRATGLQPREEANASKDATSSADRQMGPSVAMTGSVDVVPDDEGEDEGEGDGGGRPDDDDGVPASPEPSFPMDRVERYGGDVTLLEFLEEMPMGDVLLRRPVSGQAMQAWLDEDAETGAGQADTWRSSSGETLMHVCAMNGHTEALVVLLGDDRATQWMQRGLVVDGSPSDSGWTPLHAAARHQHMDACLVLMGAGARPGARNDESMATPLHYVARVPWSSTRDEAMVARVCERMLQLDEEASCPDRGGVWPLHYACGMGTVSAVRVLARHARSRDNGRSLVAPDAAGHTPLWWAVESGRFELVRELVEGFGIPVDATTAARARSDDARDDVLWSTTHSVHALPDEVLCRVFRWTVGDALAVGSEVDAFRALVRIAGTCRRWRRLAGDPLVGTVRAESLGAVLLPSTRPTTTYTPICDGSILAVLEEFRSTNAFAAMMAARTGVGSRVHVGDGNHGHFVPRENTFRVALVVPTMWRWQDVVNTQEGFAGPLSGAAVQTLQFGAVSMDVPRDQGDRMRLTQNDDEWSTIRLSVSAIALAMVRFRPDRQLRACIRASSVVVIVLESCVPLAGDTFDQVQLLVDRYALDEAEVMVLVVVDPDQPRVTPVADLVVETMARGWPCVEVRAGQPNGPDWDVAVRVLLELVAQRMSSRVLPVRRAVPMQRQARCSLM